MINSQVFGDISFGNIIYTIDLKSFFGNFALNFRKKEKCRTRLLRRLQEKYDPGHYVVPRYIEIQKIINSVLLENKTNNITILRGPKSCGKTTLALLFCCLPQVLKHFKYNIFWVDFSDQYDPIQQMRLLYEESSGMVTSLNTIDDLKTALYEQWHGIEPRLIILDGVEKDKDLKLFFDIRSQNCSWLVTTRDESLVNIGEVIDQRIKVGYFSLTEVRALLMHPLIDLLKGTSKNSKFRKISNVFSLFQASKIVEKAINRGFLKKNKFNLKDLRLDKLDELISYLYEWPLLADLVKKELILRVSRDRDGKGKYLPNIAINQLLQELSVSWDFNDISWLSKNSSEISRGYKDSIEKLTKEEKKKLKDLVIFPEGIPIPIHLLKKFWDLLSLENRNNSAQYKKATIKVRDFCRKLDELSLLEKYDVERELILLDPIIRQYIAQEVSKSTRLSLHQKLIHSYEDLHRVKFTVEDCIRQAKELAYENSQEGIYLKSFIEYHLENSKQ